MDLRKIGIAKAGEREYGTKKYRSLGTEQWNMEQVTIGTCNIGP